MLQPWKRRENAPAALMLNLTVNLQDRVLRAAFAAANTGVPAALETAVFAKRQERTLWPRTDCNFVSRTVLAPTTKFCSRSKWSLRGL